MNKKYRTSITKEEEASMWGQVYPDNKVNGVGRDNTGTQINYKVISDRELIAKQLNALLEKLDYNS